MISGPGSAHTRQAVGAHATAEGIASRDHNNLYLTSRYFRDPERYRAFCAYYAVMRVVDDRVDDLDRSRMTVRDRRREHQVLSAWEKAIDEGLKGRVLSSSGIARCDHPDGGELLQAFVESQSYFPTPSKLWTNFFRAMRHDLDHDRFQKWCDFLAYAEGASVAPTTIYLLLLTANPAHTAGDVTLPPGFDLMTCGRQLGTFAYLGHIARDLAQDLGTGSRGLLYVSGQDLAIHQVTEHILRADLERRRASVATRRLVADLVDRARQYLALGRESMAPLRGHITRDRAFILELIVTIYERVIDKIDRRGFDTMAGRHRLTELEKMAVVQEVADRVGFELTAVTRSTG